MIMVGKSIAKQASKDKPIHVEKNVTSDHYVPSIVWNQHFWGEKYFSNFRYIFELSLITVCF